MGTTALMPIRSWIQRLSVMRVQRRCKSQRVDTSLIARNLPVLTPRSSRRSCGRLWRSALYDPQLSIPDNIPVLTDHTYELPVNITIEPTVVGIISSTYTVKYDTGDLDFLGASNGATLRRLAGR